MKKNVLFIDTSDRDVAKISLQINDKQFEAESKRREKKSQVTLVLITRLIKKAGIKLSDIDTINVKVGPGSYTGLRVGVSIANVLSFALQTGVNGKRVGILEDPKYDEKN